MNRRVSVVAVLMGLLLVAHVAGAATSTAVLTVDGMT